MVNTRSADRLNERGAARGCRGDAGAPSTLRPPSSFTLAVLLTRGGGAKAAPGDTIALPVRWALTGLDDRSRYKRTQFRPAARFRQLPDVIRRRTAQASGDVAAASTVLIQVVGGAVERYGLLGRPTDEASAQVS